MVNSVVYENVTYKQINDMKHALGFDNRKIRGTKYRRYEPYRNFFMLGHAMQRIGNSLYLLVWQLKAESIGIMFPMMDGCS